MIAAHVWGTSHLWDFEATYGEFWRRGMMGVGQAGVPIFFAASGYLLYLPFAKRDFGGGGRVDVRQYALNRTRRIFPLYYVSIVIVLLFSAGGGTFEQWWRFLLFAENFSVATEGTVNGPLWTLVVDLHFYVLLPLIALGIAWVARGRLAMAVGLLVASVLLSWGAWEINPLADNAERLWQHNLVTSFCFIATGMLLALFRVHMQKSPRDWTRGAVGNPDVWLLAALPVIVFCVYRLDLHYLNAIAGFLVLGAAALPLGQGRLVRLLDWRPLAILGVMTFSLYIWHVPLIDLFYEDVPSGFIPLLAVTLPIVIVVGAISYFIIEKPFLSQRRTWSPDTAAKSPDTAPAQEGKAPAAGPIEAAAAAAAPLP